MEFDDAAPAIAVTDQPRLLVVEPNRRYLAVLARRMTEAGYRVVAAESAQAAIAELYRLPVDLVLAELQLPGSSGSELVAMIRQDAALRDLPVLMFTGRSDHGAAAKALLDGADGVVRKPFHFEVLFARIARELARKRSVELLRHDNATLDARVVTRAIEVGELRDKLLESEKERRRLEGIVGARLPSA